MLLRLYRSLIPRDETFIQRFCEHSRKVIEAAEAFRAMMEGDGALDRHYRELARVEEEADEITRQTVRAIHRSFVTPFDRGQILDLITALDDTIDLMLGAGRRIRRYGVPFTPQMRAMADCAVGAARKIGEAMPLLGAINGSVDQLSAISSAIRAFEREADDLLDQGLGALFAVDSSPGTKLTVERVYDLIEEVVDRCEDVSDVVDGIVIEQV